MKFPAFKIIFIVLLSANSICMSAQNRPLPNSSGIKTVAMRLKPGEDLKSTLDKYVKEHHIKAACLVTCAGSLTQAVIRYADRKEADTLKGKFEIVSLTGTLSETGSHLHISISDENGKTVGGHLKEGSLVYTTAEIVLGILPDLAFDRKVDSTFGYKELMIKEVNK